MIAGLDGRKIGPDLYANRLFNAITRRLNIRCCIGEVYAKTWIFFKLGKLYLNYAEALNEAVVLLTRKNMLI